MSDDQLPADTPWWARILIDNAREAWKLASVWWPALCTAAVEFYAEDKEQVDSWFDAVIPAKYRPHLLAAAFGISILARVIKQKGK